MIVDCHIHVWRYPDHFNKEAMLANQPRRRRDWPDEKFKRMWDMPIESYLPQMEGIVEKAIVQGQKSWDTYGVDVPNEYIAQIVGKYPDKLNWCCCVVPTEPGAAVEVEKCVKEWGAIGVGELGPGYAGYRANDEKCFPVYEKVQELGVPVIFHAGPGKPKKFRMSSANVLDLDDIAITFPDLKIVIAHMGGYKYEDAIYLLQKHENVFADISLLVRDSGMDRSMLSSYLPVVEFPYFHLLHPLLYYFTQTFGPTDKLIWATDSAGPPKVSYDILVNINTILRKYKLPEIPQDSITKIFHENWKKVFNIS
jgi:hypothetical protein